MDKTDHRFKQIALGTFISRKGMKISTPSSGTHIAQIPWNKKGGVLKKKAHLVDWSNK